MTRINTISPFCLTDSHLMAEFRELKMVPAALRRSLRTKSVKEILKSIPSEYTLNKGHVTWGYNKLTYLSHRYDAICLELINRNFNINIDSSFKDFCNGIPNEFFNDYKPTEKAKQISYNRILEKINLKKSWYRYYGKQLEEK